MEKRSYKRKLNPKQHKEDNYKTSHEERGQLLWDFIEPEWVAHLLGIRLMGLTGEEAKEMLKKKMVSILITEMSHQFPPENIFQPMVSRGLGSG